MVLANAVNLSSLPATAKEYRHEISATGVFITMDEAVRASGLIPEEMTAAEAANEFCAVMMQNLRDNEERANGVTVAVPTWFART